MLIEQIEVLPRLFGRVFIPSVVHAELTHREAPAAVRGWAEMPATWLTILTAPLNADTASRKLDDGERAAIALADSLRANLVLMDDRAGVAAARAQGFAVTGTLGVLDLAAARGWIDLAAAFARLRATSFRYRPELLEALLAEHRQDRVRTPAR